MSTLLEISNWNQLVKARSEGYDNLRIVVSEYNSNELIGTKISVVDYNTNDVYFSTLVTDLSSSIVPITAPMLNSEVLQVLNNYGFNVRFSEPIKLSDNVVTILKGLYAGGYRYVYRDYIPCLPHNAYITGVYASVEIKNRYTDTPISKIPNYVADEWEWVKAFTTYPIEDLIENGTVNNGLPICG